MSGYTRCSRGIASPVLRRDDTAPNGRASAQEGHVREKSKRDDVTCYGFAKLGDLVEKTEAFETDRNRSHGVYIRLKPRGRSVRKS
jgi:hypothetical protein